LRYEEKHFEEKKILTTMFILKASATEKNAYFVLAYIQCPNKKREKKSVKL